MSINLRWMSGLKRSFSDKKPHGPARARDESADGKSDSGMGVRFSDIDWETGLHIGARVDGGRII